MAAQRDPGSPNDLDSLAIVAHEAGATVSIQLHGECDLAALPAIRQAISEALDAGPECIVLDLSRLRFIDSSGLHATIELSNRSAAQKTRLVIIPGPPTVQRIFEISGVLDKLPFIGKVPNGSIVARPRAAQNGASSPRAFSSDGQSAGRRRSSGVGHGS